MCSCKEKIKDMKIRENIAERQAIKHDYEILEMIYHGFIFDIQYIVSDPNDILHISKIAENEYVVSIRVNNV